MRVRRLRKHAAHLEITAFINLIVVLVPFLLSTAVFSRLAVIDLTLPAQTRARCSLGSTTCSFEIVLRADAIEVGDRVGGLIQRIDSTPSGHDLRALSALIQSIKARFPDKTQATVLAEPSTPYDSLVHVIDAVRGLPVAQGRTIVTQVMFPDISIGDAPVRAKR